MALPKSKQGKSLSLEMKALLTDLFYLDNNSCVMSGMKNFVSVKTAAGSRTHIQKLLLLSNRKKQSANFSSQYPEVKISLPNLLNSEQLIAF